VKATVTVETTDGESTRVVIAVPDFIRWEKQYKARTSELATTWRMEDWTFLAWASLKRVGDIDAKFEDWQLQVLEVRLEDDAARPT
jgi:hypothetical protein